VEWNFAAVFEHFGYLMEGAVVTVQVSALSMVIAIVIGLVIALVRMAPITVLRMIASVYIDIFRSTPLLAQLVWINVTEFGAFGTAIVLILPLIVITMVLFVVFNRFVGVDKMLGAGGARGQR